jgi:hypothetical protein
MSAQLVVKQFGTWALVRLVIVLLVFLALHLARLPVLALAVALEWGMRQTDRLLIAAPTSNPWKEAPR